MAGSTHNGNLDPIVIVGSGGHAKVVIEAIRACNRFDVIGCTDSNSSISDIVGVSVLGDDNLLPALFARGVRHAFVAVGSNRLRLKLGAYVGDLGFDLPSIVHPSATISPSVRLGRGVIVMAGAVVNAEAHIGDFCIINTLAAVDHDCRLGPGTHVGPRGTLAGSVITGSGVFLGAGSVVTPGMRIGENATVGAGAAVVRDIPNEAVAVGVPARPRNRNELHD